MDVDPQLRARYLETNVLPPLPECSSSRAVLQLDTTTQDIITRYSNIKEASFSLECTHDKIVMLCDDGAECKGYSWAWSLFCFFAMIVSLTFFLSIMFKVILGDFKRTR
jgi:hypothetical protein